MNRIAEVLKDKGIKKIDLAKELDKSYNMVLSYTTNRRQPSIPTLYAIANIIDVNAKELLIDNIELK